MSLTNVERRAMKRAKRALHQNFGPGKPAGANVMKPGRESVKTGWTPEQIANFTRRIGPIPIIGDTK